jgi:hypothetical protein
VNIYIYIYIYIYKYIHIVMHSYAASVNSSQWGIYGFLHRCVKFDCVYQFCCDI